MNEKIVSNSKICGGVPCIKDTRIPVHIILSHLSAGESIEETLENFPNINKDDIQVCLEYRWK